MDTVKEKGRREEGRRKRDATTWKEKIKKKVKEWLTTDKVMADLKSRTLDGSR